MRIAEVGGSDSLLRAAVEAFYKDYYLPLDKASFRAAMNYYREHAPENFRPEYFASTLAAYCCVEAWAVYMFAHSPFTDREFVSAMGVADISVL